MKKTLAIMLTLVLALSLIACSGPSDNPLQEPSSISTDSSVENDSTTDSVDETESVSEETAATIPETVLVDEAGVKITAKSLEIDDIFGPELKLLIENNSGIDLTFQCLNASINGYMVDTMMSVDVVNGKKANDSLSFMESDLELCGIETIADIEVSFNIFDTAEWEDYLKTDAIQLKTSIADTFEYVYDDSGEPVYENNGIKIIVKGLTEDDIWGPAVVVYIENTSGQDFTVQTRDVSVNGFMVDPMFSCDVTTGKRAIDTITFMESDLEENEISAIENIELSFHVFDLNTWDDIVDTDIVNIAF